MPLLKPNSENDEKEIKDIINENIASSFKTQRPFSQLLMLNGCPMRKVGRIGSKIRKQLLKEAKNGDLTVDTVMPRAYCLIGEFLEISDVKTFEDMAIENSPNEVSAPQVDVKKFIENSPIEVSAPQVDVKKLKKQQKLEEKFGIDLTNKQWFECSIEEVKYSTFTNQPQRNFDTAYVVINEDNLEIFKESVWLKSNMGTRKIYFYNITSIDYDARGRLHASSSAIINTKSAEHVQLKFITKEQFDLMNNAFESYLEKTHKAQQTPNQIISPTSVADELLKYAELYEKGLLTKEEFEMKKAELLGNSITNPSETQTQDENYSLKQEFTQENGIFIENKPKFCPNCGTPIDEDSKFCTNCGNKLEIW